MSTRHCARALWDISVIIAIVAIVALSPALRAQSGPFDNWLALGGTDDAAACADSGDGSVDYAVAANPGPARTVTPGAGGTGDGNVGYSVDANNGPQRTGTLTIAGREHSVEQSEIPFVDISAGLSGVTQGEVAWGDYDNDGDLDIAMTGSGSTKLYRNNEGSSFTRLWPGFTAMWSSSLAWGDYDNDGDLDLVACGIVPGGSVATKLYRNDGGAFADAGAGLAGTCFCSVAWADYDNDGDLDLLTAGTGGPKLYRNDGGASFTDLGLELEAVYHSAVAWGDYDDDGDLDFLLTGYGGDSESITALYRNDSRGRFTEVPTALPGLSYGSVAWGDYDGDGDLDLVMSGRMGWSPSTRILRNDGGALFVDIAAGLPGVEQGAVAWGDYDNDGDLDILLSGGGISAVYRNEGGGFTPAGSGLPGLSYSEAAGGDYDSDGDLDVLLAGRDDAIVAMVFRNDLAAANAPPGVPSGLAASTVAGAVPLSWSPATDAETPSAALTYNLRVSTTPGGVDILSPMASPSSGLRRLPKMGNANHGTTAVVAALPPGSYYWSVQAVDTAFAGSPFAAESTLTICAAAIDPSSINPGPAGGSGTVTVTTAAGCAWTAVSHDAWITVTTGSSGTGDGSVGYSVAANAGPARSGTITIAGQTFTVNQAELICDLSLSPPTLPAGTHGTAYAQTIIAAGGVPAFSFAVTAGSLPPGIELASGGLLSGTPTLPGTYGFTVTASDTIGCQGSRPYSLPVSAVADLSLTKGDSPDPVNPGATVTYLLSVANAGPSVATGLTLTDTLPAGVSWVSASGTGWSCGHADHIVTCTRPSLGVGPAPAVTIEVTAPLVGEEIVNEATVAAVESDPQPANNTATASTTVDVYPTVTGVESVRRTDDGVLDEGETTELAITQLLIEFSESMTVTNPSNYSLIEAGANAIFDPSPCATIVGDDQAVVISGVADFPGSQRAVLSFATAFSLPAGRYRLSACPTLTDPNGNPLDGDGNGQGGDAFSRSFRIGRTNLLANPNFDTELSGWTATSPVPGEIQWGVADADDAPTSGSAEVMTSWGAAQTLQLAQCVVAAGEELYRASAKGRIASGEGGAPTLVVRVESYAGATCEGSPLAIATSSAIVGDTTEAWIETEVPAMAALGSGSLRVVLEVRGGSADSFTVDLDHAVLRVGPLFADGFESGDISAWSETVP